MAEKKITQSDIMSVYWRSFFDMASINYERFQALPYLFTFQKVFKKLYGDNKERMTRACLRHVEMFNTMPLFIPVIQGTTLALEEKIANTPVEEDTAELEESVNNIKVALMGPLAGVGDTIQGVLVTPTFSIIAASMAAEGNPLSVFILTLPLLLIKFENFSTKAFMLSASKFGLIMITLSYLFIICHLLLDI